MKNLYYNNSLADLVRNSGSLEKITIYNNRLVQLSDPVFNDPILPDNLLDYRTHFFAPVKTFGGIILPTFTFNIIVIWIHAVFLYILLYFEILRKMMIFIHLQSMTLVAWLFAIYSANVSCVCNRTCDNQ